MPPRCPTALERDRPARRRASSPPREVGHPRAPGYNPQPLGRISGTAAPGVPRTQGWSQAAGRGPAAAGSHTRGGTRVRTQESRRGEHPRQVRKRVRVVLRKADGILHCWEQRSQPSSAVSAETRVVRQPQLLGDGGRGGGRVGVGGTLQAGPCKRVLSLAQHTAAAGQLGSSLSALRRQRLGTAWATGPAHCP